MIGWALLGCDGQETQPCRGTARPDEVCIPGGEFVMGHDPVLYQGDPGSYPNFHDYAPPHKVRLSPFFMDVYPVTNAEYLVCVEAGVCWDECQALGHCGGFFYDEYHLRDPNLANHPVETIEERGAQAYCNWAGKRLPTEAEWERAARGFNDNDYPWGNDPGPCPDRSCEPSPPPFGWREVYAMPRGWYGFDVTPEGVHDLVTGTLEFTQDTYQLYSADSVENPIITSGTRPAMRGRLWFIPDYFVFDGVHFPLPAWARDNVTGGGVRCARSDDPLDPGAAFYQTRQRVLAGKRTLEGR